MTSNGDNNCGRNQFFALFVVQLMGTVLAAGSLIFIGEIYLESKFAPHAVVAMWGVVITVFVVTCVVAFNHKDVGHRVWEGLGGDAAQLKRLRRFDLASAHLIYFLADFVALAVLMYYTGGSRESLYTTFVFVIVPVSIALGCPTKRVVIAFALISVFIFTALLYIPVPLVSTSLTELSSLRKGWFTAITVACVGFPTFVYCIQRRESQSLADIAPHAASRSETFVA